MSLKITLISFLVLFGIIYQSNGDDLNIDHAENTIRFGKPLKNGDVITVKGYYDASLDDARFSLENDKCDWDNSVFDGCFTYDLRYRQQDNNFYRSLRINDKWGDLIDRYYPSVFMKLGNFKYVLRIGEDHFNATLDNFPLPMIKFVEPIDQISLFRTYGSAIIESFNIEHNDLPCTYSICV